MTAPLQHWITRIDDDRFATGLLFIGLAVVACLMPAQSDTWWQLGTGEEMWHSRQVMLHDEFTHTVAGRYWPNHEWLTQVIFFALYRIGGLPLVTAFCAGAVVTGWAFVSRLTPGPTALRLLLIGCSAALTTSVWSVRPQTLSLAFFGVTLWILVCRRHLWVLPPLFLVWANLHGAVATGGLLVFAATLSSLFVARDYFPKLLIVGVLCFVATTTTPLGLSFWLEIPSSLERLRVYDVIEWRAPHLTNPADAPFWLIAAGLAALVVMKRHLLRSWESTTLALTTALVFLLALRSTRNLALFLMCAVPLAATLLADTTASPVQRESRVSSPARAAMLALAALVGISFVAFAWGAPLSRLAWHPIGPEMIAAIASCEGPLYNRYDEGGYIIWFMKGRRVFMDSRQDPFPEELVLEQIQLEATGDYQATFQRYGIACALTPAESRLARRLRQDGWREQPAGAGWSVYSSVVTPEQDRQRAVDIP